MLDTEAVCTRGKVLTKRCQKTSVRRRNILSGLAISISVLGGCFEAWEPSGTDTGPSDDSETTPTRTPPPTDNKNLEDLVVFNDRCSAITVKISISPDSDNTSPFNETVELANGTKEMFDEVSSLNTSGIVRIEVDDDSWEHEWGGQDAALAIRIEGDAVNFTQRTA